MKIKFLYFGATILFLALASCSKNKDAVTTTADTQISFGLQSDNNNYSFSTVNTGSTIALASTSTQAFSWDSGSANISKFKLMAKKDGITTELSSGILTNIDLFALGTTLAKISIPKGTYTNVKASVVFSQTSGAPFPLTLHGTFTTGGGTKIPVEFDFNDDLEIISTVNDITVDGTLNFVNKINLHLNQFLTSITASEIDAATRTNGTIIISKTVNLPLYNKIRGNMLVCAGSIFSALPK